MKYKNNLYKKFYLNTTKKGKTVQTAYYLTTVFCNPSVFNVGGVVSYYLLHRLLHAYYSLLQKHLTTLFFDLERCTSVSYTSVERSKLVCELKIDENKACRRLFI
jgi:hypothetical protein